MPPEHAEIPATDAVDDALRMRVPVSVRAADGDGGSRFGSPDASDLRLINKLALDALAADEIFVFNAAISNNELDAYFTHMARSSLRNYVRDAKTGVAVMNSHRTGGWGSLLELPIGRSFRGELITDGSTQTVRAGAYLRRGSASNGYPVDSIIDDIRAGIVSDVSIGFRGGTWTCDSCGKDYFWECQHWAGMPDEKGELVTVTIENASLGEFSTVYDGATSGAAIGRVVQPTAVVRKAERMVGEGRFSSADVSRIEEQLHTRIRPVTIIPVGQPTATVGSSGVDTWERDEHGRIIVSSAAELRDVLAANASTQERTEEMTGAEIIAAFVARASGSIPEAERTRLDAVCGQLDRAAGTPDDAVDAIVETFRIIANPEPSAELTALTARVAELETQAADGRAYRTQLVSDTLADGVRAFGQEFQQELYSRMLNDPARSLDDIRAFQTDFQRRAIQRLGAGGRLTAVMDPNDPSGLNAAVATAIPARNATAFSAG